MDHHPGSRVPGVHNRDSYLGDFDGEARGGESDVGLVGSGVSGDSPWNETRTESSVWSEGETRGVN